MVAAHSQDFITHHKRYFTRVIFHIYYVSWESIYSVPRLVLHQSSLRALYFYVVPRKYIKWYKKSVVLAILFKLQQFQNKN